MKLRMKWFVVLAVVLLMLLPTTMLANAGKGTDTDPTTPVSGDLYSDLVEILREPVNGIPILNDTTGCEILINATDGSNISMIYDLDSDRCEIPEGADVIEVHFGRLNLARSPSHVLESAFDEAINTLNGATRISLDEAGRFLLEREEVDENEETYLYWKEIDSPRENLALYNKLLLDGDLEGNLGNYSSIYVGDLEIVRPVLNVTHFNAVVDPNVDLSHLLKTTDTLTIPDLMRAASFLAACADKPGHITVDVVFYLNTIMGLNDKNKSVYETYVDFDSMNYARKDEYTKQVYVLTPEMEDTSWKNGYWEQKSVWLMNTNLYSGFNGSNPEVFLWDTDEYPASLDIHGFAQASDDALRVISYIHAY
ncbi:MAG: hypothetical protein E4G94_05605, partial [ANME-2 cluster archaeon]